MNFFKKHIFQLPFIKETKYFFETSQRSLPVAMIDGGEMTLENMPVNLGYVSFTAEDMTLKWLDLSQLKLDILDEQLDVVVRGALLVTPKDYIPLDPLKKMTPEERAEIIPLDDVALSCAEDAVSKAQLRINTTARDRQLQMISSGGLVLIGIMVVGKVILNAIG